MANDKFINLEELSTTTQALLSKINEQANLKVDKNSITAILSEGTKIGSINGTDFYTPTIPDMQSYVTWDDYENSSYPYIVTINSEIPDWEKLQTAIDTKQPIIGRFFPDPTYYIDYQLNTLDLESQLLSFISMNIVSENEQAFDGWEYDTIEGWNNITSSSVSNTVGSTNQILNRLYLIGTTTQTSAIQSYSNNNLSFYHGLSSHGTDNSDNDSYIVQTPTSIRLEVQDEDYNTIAAYMHEGVFSIAGGTHTLSLQDALFQASTEDNQVIIRKLVNPTTATDAANKGYVDSAITTATSAFQTATQVNALIAAAIDETLVITLSLDHADYNTGISYYTPSETYLTVSQALLDYKRVILEVGEYDNRNCVDLHEGTINGGYLVGTMGLPVHLNNNDSIEWSEVIWNSDRQYVEIHTHNINDIATSTYSSTGTQAVNGTAVASAISGITYPVSSVNGATGVVSLSASDVGALPSSTTYVSSFNGSTGDITFTIPNTSQTSKSRIVLETSNKPLAANNFLTTETKTGPKQVLNIGYTGDSDGTQGAISLGNTRNAMNYAQGATNIETSAQTNITISLPSSTGTLALKTEIPSVTSTYSSTGTDAINGTAIASAISNFQTATQVNALIATATTVTGNQSSGFILFNSSPSGTLNPRTNTGIFIGTSGKIILGRNSESNPITGALGFINGGDQGKATNLKPTYTGNSSIDINLPSSSGTLALTSEIPSVTSTYSATGTDAVNGIAVANAISTHTHTEIGNLSNLVTTTKTNLVAAINEVAQNAGSTTAVTNTNPTLDVEWEDIYSDWAAGYYYNPDNNLAYTQISSSEMAWNTTQLQTAVSCTPFTNLIPVKPGENWRYLNMPVHFDSKNAEVPSVIIFDSSKAPITSYTRGFQEEYTEFTIPNNGAWMAVLYANSQEYVLQKQVPKALDKEEILNNIMANYRAYKLAVPPTTNTLTKGYICIGTDDLRSWETKSLHEMFTTNNIPYYMATIPENVKACITNDPYKTNLDYMRLCVNNGGEIVCHSGPVITEANKNDFDTMDAYFRKSKKELESYGFKINGIFKAGGEDSIYDAADPVIDAWATYYYDFGDYFTRSYPYYTGRTLLDDWENYTGLTSQIQSICANHTYGIFAFHQYNSNAEAAITALLNGLQGYTRGVDYEFVTPSQLYNLLMPTTPASGSGSGGSIVDTNTTYTLSMTANRIILTPSSGTATYIDLPIYNGEILEAWQGGNY